MKCTLVFVSGVFLWKIVCTGTQLSRRHNKKLPSTGSLRQRAVSFFIHILTTAFPLIVPLGNMPVPDFRAADFPVCCACW